MPAVDHFGPFARDYHARLIPSLTLGVADRLIPSLTLGVADKLIPSLTLGVADRLIPSLMLGVADKGSLVAVATPNVREGTRALLK